MGLSVAVAATFGCTTLQLDYQRLPAPEVLASVQEGVTTRSEVLERLGPPEEFRQPSPFDQARPTSPQRRRILEGGEVFIRDFFTYASERFTTRTFGLLPVGPISTTTTATATVATIIVVVVVVVIGGGWLGLDEGGRRRRRVVAGRALALQALKLGHDGLELAFLARH